MKLLIWLMVLLLSFLLLEVTQTSKQQETVQAVQRQDFFKDLNHNRHLFHKNMTGSWIYEIHKFDIFRKYSQNATCPLYDTFETRSPSLMTRVWDFTAATTSRARDSVVAMATRVWKKFQNITITMAARICNGVTWMTDWIWNKLTWLAEWIWDGVIWLAQWIWDELTWLAEWTWNGITWMADCILGGDTWAGKHFTVEFNYVINVAAKFYGEYLNGHVKHIQAVAIAMTWQDVFYVMSIDLALGFILHAFYLLGSCAANFIQRRRQAYKDNKDEISAADLPPTPKKPVWRPKPKKKKKRNKNGW